MPRIPLPKVRAQEPQTVRVSAPGVQPVQSGAGQQIEQHGNAMLRAGSAAVSIGNHLQQQFDLARTKEADNLASDVFRENMGAYLQTRGKDATGEKRQTTFDTIKERLDVIGRSLGNPTQRAMFRQQADARMQDALFQADKHEAQQVFVYEMSESEARVKAFQMDAVKAEPGSDEFDFYHGSMLREVDDIATKMGWPADSEQRKAARLDATTKLHAQMIDQMVTAGDVAGAKRHRDDYAAELSPEAQKTIDKVLKTAGEQETAQSMHMDFLQRGLTPLQILDAVNADEKLPVGTRDEVIRRVAAQETFVAAQRERAGTQLLEAAKAAALDGQPLTPQMRTALNDARVLDDYMAWVGRGKTADTTLTGSMLKMHAQDDPEGFFAPFVNEQGTPAWESVAFHLQNDLSIADLEKVHDYWRVWRGLEPKDAVKIETDRLVTQALIDLGPGQGGLDPSVRNRKMTDAEKNLIDSTTLKIEQSVNAAVKGRTAVSKDVTDAIDRMVKNQMRSGGGWFSSATSKPLALTPDAELQDGTWVTEFGEIPASHAYLKPEMKEIIRQSLINDPDRPMRPEQVDDLAIATEAARMVQDQNATTQREQAARVAKGADLLKRLYTTTVSREMFDISVRNDESRRMQEETGGAGPGGSIYQEATPSSEQMHLRVRDRLIRGTWGRKLATQYGLTTEQMVNILNEAGGYRPRDPNEGRPIYPFGE